MTASPYGWMISRWRRYGDVFSSRFPIFGRVVYVADPAEVKRVFTGDPTVFHAGEANALALGDALGEHSLLTLDEQRHMSQRKLLLPPFHGESVRRYVEVMAEATEREVATLAARQGDRAAPAHAGDHARGDPARGVRRARRRAHGSLPRAHPAARRALERPELDAVLRARPRRADPGGTVPQGAGRRRRADLRGDRRQACRGRRRGARRRSLAAALGAPRGRHGDDRRGAARRADDAAHGRATRPPPPGCPGHSSACCVRRACSSGSPSRSTTTTTSMRW